MNYLLGFLGGVVLCWYLTPVVRQYALKNNFVDLPGPRKVHQYPVARLGGVAIWLSFWLVIFAFQLFSSESLNFTGIKFAGIDINLWGIFLGSLVLLAAGIYDDVKDVSPLAKLVAQTAAGILVVALGIKIFWVHNPLGGPDIVIGNWTYLLVPAWIVLVINVMNWWDGIDGQATGVGVIAAIIMFFLARTDYVNQPATALMAAVLIGSGLGFLRYNFFPARIFLGDTGSMLIGFLLAICAIVSGAKLATAALVLGLPILDALWVIARRLITGRAPWQADRLHFHHRLLNLGFSQKQTVMLAYFFSALFGVIALISGSTEIKTKAIIALIIIMVILGVLITNVRRHNLR